MTYRTCLACKEHGTKPKRGANVTVEWNPAIQMPGKPTLRGHRVTAEHMAIRAYKFGVKDVMEDYDLSREEVLVACWWAGAFGPRRLKQSLGKWAKLAGWHLWYTCIQIPDPPTQPTPAP